MKEIKPAISEKHRFDYQDELFLIPFWKFSTIKILMQGPLSMVFQLSSSTGLKLSFEVLIDELKPVVAEKSQFE